MFKISLSWVSQLFFRYGVLFVILSFLGTVLVGGYLMWGLSHEVLRSMALRGAALVNDTLLEVRSFYASEVVSKVTRHGFNASNEYLSHEKTIPLPVNFALEVGKRVGSHGSGVQATLYSAYPFPWRRERILDQFQLDAIAHFQKGDEPDFSRFEKLKGRSVLRFARADRMTAGCVGCHNSHPQSPKRDWREGDVRGILEVTRPLENVVKETEKSYAAFLGVFSVMVMGGMFAVMLSVVSIRRVNRRLAEAVTELGENKVLLEKSNKELEQFAGTAAHDLLSPVKSMHSWVEVLEKNSPSPSNEKASQAIEFIKLSCRKADSLINELYQLSRIRHIDQKEVWIDLNSLLKDIQVTHMETIQSKGAQLRVSSLPEVLGTASQLESLFGNLLKNALTYSVADRALQIEISCEEKGEFYEFRVTDNGIGIAPQFQERIFEMFRRLHSESEFPGNGIGLALCKRIVELKRGRIWVESKPGLGSTFLFTYPVSRL